MSSQAWYGVRNSNEEKRVLEKSTSLLNWLTQRNFEKIKDEIVQTIIRASPSAFVIKASSLFTRFPLFPPERNTDAMNFFLSSIGKLADFQFCDDNFKLLVQNSRALELENNYNQEAKLRKEAQVALATKMGELELMKRLLESYKEEKVQLHLHSQSLEQKYQKELKLRKDKECALAIQRESISKVRLRLETLENEHNNMRLKAEELHSNYTAELILKKISEIALHHERNELEAITQLLETCKIEQENLTSQVITWQDKYDKSLSLMKETEDSLSRHIQELEIVKGLLQSCNQEADAMREERDNALDTVQELRRKHLEERQPPLLFFCPITQEVMKDPHFAADGFTYEAQAIRTWFSTGHDTSPMTNLKLPHRNLVPNHALRSAIQDLI